MGMSRTFKLSKTTTHDTCGILWYSTGMEKVTNKMLGWSILGFTSVLVLSGLLEGFTGEVQTNEAIDMVLSIGMVVSVYWGAIRLVR